MAISAGLWFASVMFESGMMVSQQFVLAALDLAHQAQVCPVVVPQWNSFRIFKPVSTLSFDKKEVLKILKIYTSLFKNE